MATVFESDMSTMRDEAIAPDDEMLGMSKMDSSAGAEPHQRSQRRRLSNNRRYFSKNNNPVEENSGADDEDRVPPPMDDIKTDTTSNDIANAASTDFNAWKREMKEMILAGTVATSSGKPKMNVVHLADRKTNRPHKHRLDKELRSVKSDSSTATAPESSDERSSSGASSQSVPLPASKKITRRKKHRKPKGAKTPRKPFDTVYVIKEAGPATKQPETKGSQPQESSMRAPQSPTITNPPPLSPTTKANSTELGAIMVGLKELKTWVEGSPQPRAEKQPRSPRRRRQSTPPSSPTNRSGTLQENSRPPPLPRSIVVPQFRTSDDDNNKYKLMIENRGIKGQGIPSEVLTIRTASTTRKKRKKKKKKRVRFHKPLVTETQYRPKTASEDIDELYFQESELLDWEKDEMTTLRDRFEIALSEFRNSNDELDEETEQTDSLLSFGTPLISFHDSYSFSFSDNSDDEGAD